MRQLPLVFLSFSALALTACGSDSGGGDDAGDEAAALAGTWKTACYAESDADGNPASYKRDELVIAGSSFVTTSSFFQKSDASCATLHYSNVLTATFAVGGEVSGIEGARMIDVKPSKLEVTPATAAAAAAFNQEPDSYCDLTGWASGVKRDVTDKACAGDLDTVYDIYKLDGKELVFGYADGEEVGSSSDRRPKTLDTAHAYTKA